MTSYFLLTTFIYAFIILAVLFCIDLKTRLLPNRYVAQFLFAGLAFHIATGFSQNPPLDLIASSLLSALLLLAIRFVGNKVYKFDTLGMGDVKLIGAAGVWLGSDYIFLGITLGALAGVLHGLGIIIFSRINGNEKKTLDTLSIPAGPGFIIGIVAGAILKYHAFVASIL